MKTKRFTPFKISRLDSLGQGVSKVSEKVVFIPKTLVGDEGEAEVRSEKKGVIFGKIKTLELKSQDRIEPQCLHFKDCPSCHYLHASYGHELSIKKESFENLFRKTRNGSRNIQSNCWGFCFNFFLDDYQPHDDFIFFSYFCGIGTRYCKSLSRCCYFSLGCIYRISVLVVVVGQWGEFISRKI